MGNKYVVDEILNKRFTEKGFYYKSYLDEGKYENEVVFRIFKNGELVYGETHSDDELWLGSVDDLYCRIISKIEWSDFGRYMVFGYNTQYPHGGINDCRLRSSDLPLIKEFLGLLDYGEKYVYDLETGITYSEVEFYYE